MRMRERRREKKPVCRTGGLSWRAMACRRIGLAIGAAALTNSTFGMGAIIIGGGSNTIGYASSFALTARDGCGVRLPCIVWPAPIRATPVRTVAANGSATLSHRLSIAAGAAVDRR